MFLWSEPAVNRLKGLWAEGHSTPVIAARLADEFGGSLTRSSVIGKANRLRLDRRDTKQRDPLQYKRAGQRSKTVTKFNFATNATKAKPAKDDEPYVYRETIVTPEDQRVSFEALEPFDRRCRYAHGDAHPYTFCGAKTVPGTSWCQTHLHAISGTKPARGTQPLENPEQSQSLEKIKELEATA